MKHYSNSKERLRYCIQRAHEWRVNDKLPRFYTLSWTPRLGNSMFWFWMEQARQCRIGMKLRGVYGKR